MLDGDEEIAEYNGATVLRHYVTGPGVDDRIAHAEGSAIANPTKTYYHVNHQGSVMAMTDGSGNLTQRVGYDEYGNGSPATGEQFGYTGRRYDPETGLYYYRARYYAPAIGRFLQVDPVGYKDNLNLYTYVGNDPLDRNDPTGNGPDMFYSSSDMAAMGQMAQVRAVQDEARAEALSYPNRQVALTSVAAASAAGTFTPLAPAAGPLSVLATVAALTDKVITTGKVEVTDLLLSILPAFKLAKAASALTGIAEIGSTVKTGQEALHAGAAAMGAAAAVIEKKEGEGQRPVTAKPQPKVPSNQSPPTPGPWASCARGIPSTC